MKIVFIILAVLLAVLLIVFLVLALIHKRTIINHFDSGNVIVFGAKGKGKDLLFQKIINSRHRDYLANIDFGGNYEEIALQSLDIKNDYANFVAENINVVSKENYPYENRDIYLSDCGIILPSQCDSLLSKLYGSLPVAFALSRHLWNNNIHLNTQALNRVWIKLREQADYYIKCLGVIKLPFFLIIRCRTFDKYESAEQNLLPLKSGLFNKYDKALVKQYEATNGEIANRFLIVPKWSIHYDTRAYHKKIFGENAKNC